MANPAPDDRIAALAAEVGEVIERGHDEHRTTRAVADVLRGWLATGARLPRRYLAPRDDRYVMYPLHVDAAGRFSIASAVWNVGQGTPVHGHETWGVVGIYSGREHETRYVKPQRPDAPLAVEGESVWAPGEVTVCCTTDDDVHTVSCDGDEPCVGIHIYGADIGTLRRRSYDPDTGTVDWFVSQWGEPDTSTTRDASTPEGRSHMDQNRTPPNDRAFTPALRRSAPKEFAAYAELSRTALHNEEGALPPKTRELIAIAVALTTQCEMCLDSHVKAAHEQGASEAEVAETTFVAAALRAGGAVTHGMKAMRMYSEHEAH